MFRAGSGRDRDLAASINLSVPAKGPERDILGLLGVLPDGIGDDDANILVPHDGDAAAAKVVELGLAYWENARLRTLAPIREHFARDIKPRPKLLERCRQFHLERLQVSARENSYPKLAAQTGNLEAMLIPALAGTIHDDAAWAAIDYSQFHRFTGLGRGIILLERMMKRLPAHGRSQVRAAGLRELAAWNAKNLKFDLSCQQLETARRLATEIGDADGLALSICELGRVAMHRGNMEEADALLTSALTTARHLHLRGHCERELSEFFFRQSQLDLAGEHLSPARNHYGIENDPTGLGSCHTIEGKIAWRQGNLAAVQESARMALPLTRSAGNISAEAHCHLLLALAAFEAGDWAKTRDPLPLANTLLMRANNLLYDVDASMLTARLALAESADIKSATEAINRALAILDGKEIPRHQTQCLCVQGEIALARQDWDDAKAKFNAALALYPRHRGDDIAGDCWRGLGDAACAQSQVPEAREAWNTAIDHYSKFPNPHWIAQIKLRLARLAGGDERAALVTEMREVWQQPGFERRLEKLDEFHPSLGTP